MKHKVSELTGPLLDQAVAKGLGWRKDEEDASCWWTPDGGVRCVAPDLGFMPSSAWGDGGPIIERERITIGGPDLMNSGLWEAFIDPVCRAVGPVSADITGLFEGAGPTPLVAAMRAFVASKFGKEVEL